MISRSVWKTTRVENDNMQFDWNRNIKINDVPSLELIPFLRIQLSLGKSLLQGDHHHYRRVHQYPPYYQELMKDDRIFLRNKIKDYLKELKENRQKEDDWENEQMQILLQIFVESNKKKSLSKIQKGDKVMDWLQIKLRKFIDNNKKERHKKEVESFRKIKGLNPRKQL